MSTVERQIHHARRRLTRNMLLDRTCLGLLVAAGSWAIIVLIARLFALPWPVWHIGWVAALLGLTVSVVITIIRQPTPLLAALTLDDAAGLKERMSTAFAFARSGDPWARAALQDAEQTAGRVHVPTHIRYQSPRLLPWSTASILAALILAWFMPTVDLLAGEETDEDAPTREEVLAEHNAIKIEMDKQLNKIKELSEDKPEFEDLIKDIQPLDMPEEPDVTPEDIRREAVKRIDDVQDRLKERLESSESEAFREMKERLKKLNTQSNNQQSDKLSEALAEGDFTKAKEALQEMMQEIKESAKNSNDPEAQQKLEQIEQQLGNLAEQLAKLGDSLELQKELENKGGMSPEQAKKLLDQLSKMDPKQLEKELQKRLGDQGVSSDQIKKMAQKIAKNQQAQKAMKQMAQALAKASQACQQCQNPGQAGSGSSQAAGAMSDALSQLSSMEMTQQLMNELEVQMSDWENLRGGVCEGGMGQGEMRGPRGPIGQQGGNYGLGLGARIGKERTAFQTDATKAKTRFDSGAVIGQLLVDGPQVRGEASAEVLDAADADVRDALDAIDRKEVPRQYDKALREYFDRVAGLVEQRKTEATDDNEDPAESEDDSDADTDA